MSQSGADTTMPGMCIDRPTRQNRNAPMEFTVPACRCDDFGVERAGKNRVVKHDPGQRTFKDHGWVA